MMKENISELEDSAVNTTQNGTCRRKMVNKRQPNISVLWVNQS